MGPSFRSDLNCSREEQQGVVFYRIDDPDTQTSFRLYEIEYLIAQKLDGSRNLDEVISAVKSEYNFDITKPDLEKFVSQLESMGFVRAPGGNGEIMDAAKADTAVMKMPGAGGPPPPPPGAGSEETVTNIMTTAEIEAAATAPDEVLNDGDFDPGKTGEMTAPPPMEMMRPESDEFPLEDTDTDVVPELEPVDDVDEAELNRLLRSAFLHVKQGYIVHARDYFLAAKELDPGDDRIAKLVGHLEIIGDSGSPEDVEQIWSQASQLFPEIVDDIGPMLDGETEQDSFAAAGAADDNLKARVVWLVVLLVILAGGGGGGWWAVNHFGLLAGSATVRTVTATAEEIPVFHPESATEVGSVNEAWLKFGGAGKVGSIAVEQGAEVEKGDVLATLALKKPVEKKLNKAQANVEKAEASYDKAAKALEKLLAEREQLETERDGVQTELKKMRPESILKRGGVSKRDLEKLKRSLAKANKKLSQLAKKERKPRGQEKKAKKKLAGARKKLAGIEKKVGGKLLRAPFAGQVMKLDIAEGAKVDKSKNAILLRDPRSARILFKVADAGELQAGGQASVSVGAGKPAEAKVVELREVDGGVVVEVHLVDPTGSFAGMSADDFKLVKEFVASAFQFPASALLTLEDGESAVVVANQLKAARRTVELVQQASGTIVVRDSTGTLHDGDQVIVEVVEGELSTLAEQSPVQVQGQ